MSRKKTKRTVPYHARRPGCTSSQHVEIFFDMLDSPAFHDLTRSQVALFLYCKRSTHGSATRDYYEGRFEGKLTLTEPEAVSIFYMNFAQVSKTYELYPESSKRCFRDDMAALIEHGFVDTILNGSGQRKKIVYMLSSRWHKWGTPDFEVPERCMTEHMARARRKAMSEGSDTNLGAKSTQDEDTNLGAKSTQTKQKRGAKSTQDWVQKAPRLNDDRPNWVQKTPRFEQIDDESGCKKHPEYIYLPSMGDEMEEPKGVQFESVSGAVVDTSTGEVVGYDTQGHDEELESLVQKLVAAGWDEGEALDLVFEAYQKSGSIAKTTTAVNKTLVLSRKRAS